MIWKKIALVFFALVVAVYIAPYITTIFSYACFKVSTDNSGTKPGQFGYKTISLYCNVQSSFKVLFFHQSQ